MKDFYVNNGPPPRRTLAQRISDCLVKADTIVLSLLVGSAVVVMIVIIAVVAYEGPL